jgi:hypothetical protein
MPRGTGAQHPAQRGNQGIINVHTAFEMQRLHLKKPFFAMGFGVKTANQRIVVQNRQAEVAIFAFVRGKIESGLLKRRRKCFRRLLL